ncbi:MAG: hypothetical protein JOZ28_11365 [Candidatus Eremiobacteraeota bacterium]|nr:hypothetical protein [Candidatus Eremiobacteraeota bacterium]
MLDLTTHEFAQYTPLLPQTAVNYDFSIEHDFGDGLELRITPYYRKGFNYAVADQLLLFLLPSGTPVFGPPRVDNSGINKNAGIEFALQRSAQYGFSGLVAATYDDTLANYLADFFPGVNSAALAAGHLYHVAYVSPVTGTANIVYGWHSGLHASATISYASGYPYGVGKWTYVFGPNGQPMQVNNTDVNSASGKTGAYYVTNGSGQIVASRGTQEGGDPGTLLTPSITTVNFTISQIIGHNVHNSEVGIRAENLFGNYAPTRIPSNPYYGFSGFGNGGSPSGVNGNACAPGQSFSCQPFQYNYSSQPYELEQTGPPRLYTFYFSMKY